MDATANEAAVGKPTFEQGPPGLQLKRALLPINEYAAREGVSRGIVEECGKLGIVQTRKCKGKLFVVDVPLSPYRSLSDAGGNPMHPIDKLVQSHKISELVKKIAPTRAEAVKKLPELSAENDLVKERLKPTRTKQRRLFEVTSKTRSKVADEVGQPQESFEPIRTPELEQVETDRELSRADEAFKKLEETFEITDKLLVPIDELTELKETSKPLPIPRDKSRFNFSTAQARSERIWQIAAVFLILFLLAAIFANFRFYMNRKMQLDRLELAYTSVQKVYDNFAEASQRAEGLEDELSGSRAEVERVQNELNKSKTEVEAIRSELAQARQKLETLRGHNFDAVEQLNKQIQSLTTRLAELAKNP